MRCLWRGAVPGIWLALAAVAAATTPPAAAVPSGADRVDAIEVPSATAIELDGRLDESVWSTAPVIDQFVQREPAEGAAPTFRTEARVAYDAVSLYVGIRAFDPDPSAIVGLLTRRDQESPSDWLKVGIDSFHDRRTAYEFAVNPAGVKQDRYHYNDTDEDLSWDAIWDVVVEVDEKGWKAEFRIPFSQLRFDRNGSGTFGFAIAREIGRLNETSTWPLLARSASGLVSSFGELGGLRFARSARRLELVPYVVSRVTTEPDEPANPLLDGPALAGEPGLDLKYAVTPALTFTGTLNPDFGQVEADPAVVNLSAFETFFSERRPFFIEGSGVFRFDVDCNDGNCTGLFYSRRIGRSPQGDPDTPDDGYDTVPSQTTILGASKLTGRAGGFSLGALNAVTASESATIADGSTRLHQDVEPFTSYSVVRLRREFDDQSSLGFMTTATNRQITPETSFLAGEAYSGGVDGNWRLGDRFEVRGYWAGSAISGDAEAIERLQTDNRHSFQRPDADHLSLDPTATSLRGHSGLFAFSKIAGETLRFDVNVGYKSPGFEINDVGFLRRADQKNTSAWIQWRHDTPSRYLRTFRLNLNAWRAWNFGGDRLWSGGNVNAHATFTNNWSTGAGYNVNQEGFDDRLTRGGPGGRTTPRRNVWLYVEGDNRKPVFVGYNVNWMQDDQASSSFSFSPNITIRPTSTISVQTGLRYSHDVNDYQWIEKVSADTDHSVLGHLDQTTVSMTSRLTYTITPDLSIQIYAEPFVSTGDYSGFKELVDGRADAYADRFAPFAYQDDPDFNFRSFRTTNVLRWEYRPGSTFFVVWQQARQDRLEGLDTFGSQRDLRDVFDVPATNVLLVKFAYWLNF